jgi:hypothetical protein
VPKRPVHETLEDKLRKRKEAAERPVIRAEMERRQKEAVKKHKAAQAAKARRKAMERAAEAQKDKRKRLKRRKK